MEIIHTEAKSWWDKDPSKGRKIPKLESSVEKPVVAYAKKLGCLVRKMNGLGFAGFPDRLFLMPKGASLWIEFKAPGKLGSLSANQELIIEQLREMGHSVLVIDDVGKGKAAIDAHMSIQQ